MTDETIVACPRCLARTAGREGVFSCGEVVCPACDGEGLDPIPDAGCPNPPTCRVCDGEGAITCPTCGGEKVTTEARAAAWMITAGSV